MRQANIEAAQLRDSLLDVAAMRIPVAAKPFPPLGIMFPALRHRDAHRMTTSAFDNLSFCIGVSRWKHLLANLILNLQSQRRLPWN